MTPMLGAVVTEQLAVELFVTGVSVQLSRPVPVNVVETVQALAGTVFVVVKLAMTPGAMVLAEKTTVFATGKLETTTTLVNALLPVFCTEPVLMNVPPDKIWDTGHKAVTKICGVVVIEQVAVAELLTGTPHRLFAVAVKVSVAEQFVGAR